MAAVVGGSLCGLPAMAALPRWIRHCCCDLLQKVRVARMMLAENQLQTVQVGFAQSSNALVM